MPNCNGCTACCDLIMLDGISHSRLTELHEAGVIDPRYIEILKPITREEALVLNRQAVLDREAVSRWSIGFYTCRFVTKDGCSRYDDRPDMCSNYPFGDKEYSHADLCRIQYVRHEPQYVKGCSFVPELIAVVNL